MSSFGDLIQHVSDSATRSAMEQLYSEMLKGNKKTNDQVRDIYDFCDYIDDRLRNQERYTSKDCVIIQNPPFNAEDNINLAENIIKFFKTVLKIEKVDERGLKAFHILPSKKPLPNGILPAVIVKFVYFADKDTVFRSRRQLRDYKNPLNNKKYVYRRKTSSC